ncbi:MAG TPA: ubiquinol-cytochrome c reductase iron-sulfur subunit [Thermodesulfobacteriota bacterium]|nr:ubiquinol-cytochrome c reductase iron-sulfur subunit [Thermodesulfobacteriota bacterium]
MDRRKFTNLLLGFGGIATIASILFPIITFFRPPKSLEITAKTVEAATINELPVNGWKIFEFGRQPALLIRRSKDEFLAFSATCTHLTCIVQYQEDKRMILCACHNGLYNLHGINVAGPPPRPLEKFKTTIVEDKVFVSRD